MQLSRDRRAGPIPRRGQNRPVLSSRDHSRPGLLRSRDRTPNVLRLRRDPLPNPNNSQDPQNRGLRQSILRDIRNLIQSPIPQIIPAGANSQNVSTFLQGAAIMPRLS